MILIDNKNILRKRDRDLLNRLSIFEGEDVAKNIVIEKAKTGAITLKKQFEGKIQYIHSKYDPEKEAQSFISKFENETFKNVLFI